MKKTAAALLALLICLTFGGCQGKQDYDVSSYLKGVLSESYSNGSAAAAATDRAVSSNSATTAENAAVRFFEKYKMNPSEEQKSAMTEVFQRAYANSKYTVKEKTEAAYGFDVVVEYEVQTTFQGLQTDINSRREEAERMGIALETGADYIDGVISLCSNSVDAPTYSGTGSLTFDIKVDEELNLSLNVKLFDRLDQEILPL